jgi:predicted Ser/Thr protein kinase
MASSTPSSFGRYQIKTEIGRGGMAVVYHAFDPRFGREVAIKVLPQQFLFDPQFRERFEREAKTVAMLEHDAIVPVYDFGEQNDQPFIVMRYMAGGSLEQRLRRGPMSLQEITPIFTRLAGALDVAHAAGVIHRDLKPGNILFDRYGKAFLSDFGIARLVQAGFATMTGSAIVGTPAYMSPEQVEGEKDLDGRSDVYALGVILFQMLTGSTPYQAATPAKVLIMHLMEPVPHVTGVKADLTPDFDTLIERAMAKTRDQRYQTAGAMASALETVFSSRATLVPTSPPPLAETFLAETLLPAAEPALPAVEVTRAAQPRAVEAEQPAPQPPSPVADEILALAAEPLAEPTTDEDEPPPPAVDAIEPDLPSEAPAVEMLASAPPVESAEGTQPQPEETEAASDAPPMDVVAKTWVVSPPVSPGPARTAPRPVQAGLFTRLAWLLPVLALLVCVGLSCAAILLARRMMIAQQPVVDTGAEASQVYFTSDRQGKREIYLLNRDGGVQQITSSPGNAESWGGMPAPGGGFYFTSTRSGERQIFRMTGSGEVQQITRAHGESWGAVPAPGGGIYFTSTRSGKREIYRMTKDGEVMQITATAGEAESWAAMPFRGGGIAFTSTRSGKREIYRMTNDGAVTQITATTGDAESWGVMPLQGGGMLFTSSRSGKPEIYRINAAGMVTQLTNTPGRAASWGATPADPDGLYFNSNRDGPLEIYWMTPSGSVQRVTSSPAGRQSWLEGAGDSE